MWIVIALVLVLGCCGGIAGLGFFGLKTIGAESKAAVPVVNSQLDALKTAKDLRALIAKIKSNALQGTVEGTCFAKQPDTEALKSTTELKMSNFRANSSNGKDSMVAQHFREYTLGDAKLRLLVDTVKQGGKWQVDSVSVECDPKPLEAMPEIFN